MTTCNFKFCDNFKISRLIFNCHRGSYDTDELEFHLFKPRRTAIFFYKHASRK